MVTNRIFSFSVILALACLCSGLQAQESASRSNRDKKNRRQFSFPLDLSSDENANQDNDGVLQSSPQIDLAGLPLEAAINPDEYIVGPGDILQINIWVGSEGLLTLPVLPEGKLVIPTIGSLNVKDKTLTEVQQLVSRAAAKKYVNKNITADLVALRRFRVHVTGQVNAPGPYAARGVNRISDLVETAGGLTSWAVERKIEVRHLDGTVDIVDLQKYQRSGDIDANIYVRQGDVIFVPAIDLSVATVRIEGQVPDAGVYDLQENETVAQFLQRINAFSRRTDLRSAYIVRSIDGNGTTRTIPLYSYAVETNNDHAGNYFQDGDVIRVPRNEQDVFVIGAVKEPGRHPYYPDLRAFEYVGLAGGHEKAAGFGKIKVIRAGTNKEIKGAATAVEPGDTIFIPEKTEFGVREITQIVSTLASVILTLVAVNGI